LKKEFCAGNQKIVPAHRKKTKKIRRENWEFFWWEREEEKRNLHTREKKNVGFFSSFCSPVALQMARFCAEAKQWRDKRKHFAETKQRILRKRRRRKEKRNHHSSLPQRDISHCIRINC